MFQMFKKKIETDPYILLAADIVKAVINDLKDAINFNDTEGEYKLKAWLTSDYGQLLTLGQSEYIISMVYKTM